MVSTLFLSIEGLSESRRRVLAAEIMEVLRGEGGWQGVTLDEGWAADSLGQVH